MDVIEISKCNTKGFFSNFDTLNTTTKNKLSCLNGTFNSPGNFKIV